MAYERSRALAYGAFSAIIGASCMTVVRSAARRLGLIEKMVPQVIEERLVSGTRLPERGAARFDRLGDQLLHLAYGAALGGAYGLALRRRDSESMLAGVALGVGTWLFGSGVLLPAIGASRPIVRRSLTENAVDALAHLSFGVATEIVRSDLLSHSAARDVRGAPRRDAKTG